MVGEERNNCNRSKWGPNGAAGDVFQLGGEQTTQEVWYFLMGMEDFQGHSLCSVAKKIRRMTLLLEKFSWFDCSCISYKDKDTLKEELKIEKLKSD